MDPIILKTMLENIQKEIQQTKISIQESEQRINDNINMKFRQVDEKIQRLEDTVIMQKNKLDFFDRHLRQRNILIYGVHENEKNYDELVHNVLEICKILKVNDCTKLEIQAVRRVRNKANKTRPIMVTFSTLGRKLEVLRAKKNLKNTEYYIKEDFPAKVAEVRKQLQVRVKEEIEKGNIAYIKYDKIVIRSPRQKKTSYTEKQNNKRTHSESPTKNKTITKKHTMKEYWRSPNSGSGPKQQNSNININKPTTPPPTSSNQQQSTKTNIRKTIKQNGTGIDKHLPPTRPVNVGDKEDRHPPEQETTNNYIFPNHTNKHKKQIFICTD
ncbi:hypothetical protein O0L34_g4859 [Tuta absoluta]|nr:hypothetical protein O0L34_g4859 [Tuta absoluta]